MKKLSSLARSPFGSAMLGGSLIAVLGAIAIGAGWIHADDRVTTLAQAPLPTTQAASDTSAGLTVSQIYDRAGPGVVHIEAESVSQAPSANPFDPFGAAPRRQTATGSGFVIDGDGHIVTNAHVVDGSQKVRVTLTKDGDPVDAKVVGRDPSTDIAVLQVDVPLDQLHPVELADSTTAEVGDPVVAIGNPFALDRTVTSGIVSAVQRQIQSPNGFTIDNAIQTDASINPGNSGGPLLDAEGKVLGVTSQIESQSGGNVGIGFAVPSVTVRKVASQLIADGKVQHAFVGISGGDVTKDIADLLNLGTDHGAIVQSVVPGSPAAKAGIEAGDATVNINGQRVRAGGDVIVAVDGKDITGMDEVVAAVDAHKPGDEIEFRLLRHGQERTVTLKLAERPAQAQS